MNDDNLQQYGYVDGEQGYPLAAWIWGHRLRIGQHWMEYLLEFLNVLAGFEYEIGRGINQGENGTKPQDGYKCFTRLGLRRFVFYDEREKTRHPDDNMARQILLQELEERNVIRAGANQDPLVLSKTLLRSLSAIEEERSWFAKSLLPVHHNLLFWEALRKGATKYRSNSAETDKTARELDAPIAFDPRNFFARGGEVYYLILSAGTRDNPGLRQAIAVKLRQLLNEHNSTIGDLAQVIDEVWDNLTQEDEGAKYFNLGWIPEPDSPFYRTVAEDLAQFLEAQLDPLETLDLLAHLICFHLTLYIYYHANRSPDDCLSMDEGDFFSFPATFLIDVLHGRDGGVIRTVSAILYQQQETKIVSRAEDYVLEYINASNLDDPKEIDVEVRRRFGINRLRRKSREELDQAFDKLWQQHNTSQISLDGFIEAYARAVTLLLMNDFKKNFLGVHRKLAKAVGFVLPKKGPHARYVLEANLLKALVIANVQPGNEVIFDDFLDRLYRRYGLIIGPREARESGLYNRQHINSEYYEQNRRAFLEKMRYGGLAHEYSDATAMVRA